MDLMLYDTFTNSKKKFEPIDPNNVRMYVCGPTVYDYAHVGNARPVIVFDILFRLLQKIYGSENVTYVRNITDVDDKIIHAANDQNEDIGILTEKTINYFHDDAKYIGALKPTFEPRATEHIPEMIELIEKLISKEFAYIADGNVLFSSNKFKEYGKLSGKNLDEMVAGSRVGVESYKKEESDFVLWKPSKEDEPSWKSPWGDGRPGWHIECSAMSEKLLGENFDIHGGGQDLIFPHHENEIAQGSCCSSSDYCNYWFHNGIVLVDKKKMSKSLGNIISVSDILDKENPIIVRIALMSAHYRQPLNWTQDTMNNSRNIYEKIISSLEIESSKATERDDEFIDLLCDDLNTPNALQYISKQARDAKKDSRVLPKLRYNCGLIGIKSNKNIIDKSLVDKIESLISLREAARKNKDYIEADRLRDVLSDMDVALNDGSDGVSWKIKH